MKWQVIFDIIEHMDTPEEIGLPQEGNHKLDERIKFLTGDITDTETDVIVCPSLPDLDVMYMGVAGAIMRKGGDKIFAEARAIGKRAQEQNPDKKFPIPLHSAHLTSAGNLPKAKHVIHSVAVNYSEEDGLSCDSEAIFRSAWNVLVVADKNSLASVAFPALGAGLYQVPLDQSFGAIAQASDLFFKNHPQTSLKEVSLVSFNPSIPKPKLIDELRTDLLIRELRGREN